MLASGLVPLPASAYPPAMRLLGSRLVVSLAAACLPLSPAFAQTMAPDMAGMKHSAHPVPTDPAQPTPADPHTGHNMASMAMASDGLFAPGSGTSRLPGGGGRHHGIHVPLGDWHLMVHGQIFTTYSNQGGPRGSERAFFTSHLQVQGERALSDRVKLTLRGLFSADPLIGDRGYPLLFQTGESAGGQPLVDRQHPHDIFAELTARLDFDLGGGTQAFLYGGPAGEPALGPAVYLHRASARFNPEAPLTHHWFDSTHLSFGVVTAGIARRHWQLEASAFRGREPDEVREDIETPKLDSWSVRATWNPVPAWQVSLSYGRLKSVEALHPDEDESRLIATIAYEANGLAVTAGYGRKDRIPGRVIDAFFVEGNWDISARHAIFGRFENANNDELFPDEASPLHGRPFRISKVALGYAWTLPVKGPVSVAVGALGSVYAKPAVLDASYGRAPKSFVLFARFGLGH